MLTGSSGLDPSHEDAAGGRIGVLAGPDGVLMIDSQYAQLTDKVLAAVRRISTGPIRYLVNTHIHRDHTAGNAFFAKQGAVIFAREELRDGMVRLSQGAQCRHQSRGQSGRLPGHHLRDGRAGENSHERRSRRLHSDPGGPYRRRHQHQVREGERALHRRFLPQLRLSLHRHQQRRLAQGHAGGARRHHEVGRRQHASSCPATAR